MNNFADDARIISVWNFEPGHLLEDSKGSNTWDNTGGAGSEDTTNYKQGSGSIYCAGGAYSPVITDANLSADFPLKSGDAVAKASFAFWHRPATLAAAYAPILAKCSWYGTYATFILRFQYATLRFVWIRGYVAAEYFDFTGITFVAGRDYHIGVRIDGVNKVLEIRVYDEYNDIAVTCNFTPSLPLLIDDHPFRLGGDEDGARMVGNWDEFVVANDLLTDDEFDLIRQGAFPGLGHRTFPIPNPKTVWQSQTGKRTFPLPGEQV